MRREAWRTDNPERGSARGEGDQITMSSRYAPVREPHTRRDGFPQDKDNTSAAGASGLGTANVTRDSRVFGTSGARARARGGVGDFREPPTL